MLIFASSTSKMFYRFIKFILTYSPSSAQVAQNYADNVSKPMRSKLTPLRLAYYAYLLLLFTRLGLNSLFQGAYNRYDFSVYLFNSIFRHHMVGLMINCFVLMALVFDYTIVLGPHPLVAPMLTDLLQSEGSEKG